MDELTVLQQDAELTRQRDSHPARPSRRRQAFALLAGLSVTILMYLGLDSGRVPAAVSLLLLGGLLLLVPTAQEAPRRLAVNGALVIGWVPLLWWKPWPVPLNHGVLLVAVGWGALVLAVVKAPDVRRAVRGLIPTAKPADLAIAGGGLLALAAMSRWAFADTPKHALTLLLPGADNYPHFAMFAGIRTHGATLGALGPAPDGSRWGFFNYPQGFHGLAATLSELLNPHLGPGPEMLVSYTQAVAAIVILGVVVLTAAVVAVPGLRDRPGLLLVALTVTWAGFLWEPGQKAIVDGFANFWLGALAAGAALLISVATPRCLASAHVAAVGGLWVACAQTWTPLLLFALPAGLVLTFGWRKARFDLDFRSRLLVAAGVVTATALAIAATVVLLLRTVSVNYLVTTQTGGLHGTSPLPTFVLMVLALYSCLTFPAWSRRSDVPGLPEAGRVRPLAWAALTGLLVLSAFLVAQLRLIGTTAYYFLKYVVGFELVMTAVAPAMVALVLAALAPKFSGWKGLMATLAACAVATQVFGPFPPRVMPLFSDSGDGTAGLGAPLSAPDVATGVLAAVEGTRAESTLEVDYFPLGRQRALNPFYADAWFHALQHSLTESVFDRYAVWRVESRGLDSAAALIGPVLDTSPSERVVVNPAFVAPLRKRLSPEIRGRLVGW